MIIDNEFKVLIPKLSSEEVAQLEENIKSEGCRDALIVWQGILLDGHNRFEICNRHKIPFQTKEIELADRDAAKLWIIRNQFGRRNLGSFDRGELALKMKGIIAARAKENLITSTGGNNPQPLATLPKPDTINTRAEIAKIAGVSERTISKVETILKKGTPEQISKLRSNDAKTSINKVFNSIKKTENKRKAEKALEEAQNSISEEAKQSIELVCDIRHCSCADLFASGIKPDAVITDPPYPKEYLHLFDELAESCSQANVPLVAVMSGQTYLPEVMQKLCSRLQYRWTIAYLTPGGQSVQQFPVKVNTFWKPVFLFGEAIDWIGDVSKSTANDNDKRFHGWGQSESGMADLVKRLTKPGQLVCDPFLGGGTTAVVSLALGRRFVGCDIDEDCVLKSKRRVETQWK